MQEFILNRKGMPIGKLKLNIKKLAFIAGASFSLVALNGCKDKTVESPKIAFEGEYPRINKFYVVDYTIDYNDTLTGLVSSYISEDNINYYVDLIARENNLENPNSIKAGDKIKLIGVKEEYLSHFGYTVDEDIIPVEIQIKDRTKFINEHKDILVYNMNTTDNEEYKSELSLVLNDIENLNSFASDSFDMIEELKFICDKINTLYGDDYNDYKTAYKIDSFLKKGSNSR